MTEGIVLPGWSCAHCGVFNGSAKEERTSCRSCEAPRGPELEEGPWEAEDLNNRHLVYVRVPAAAIQVAACAPEALRLLLDREWVTIMWEKTPDGGSVGRKQICMHCPNEKHEGHTADCAWLALMKRAGLR